MASNYINIAPANLFLKVGETKQLQIDCDFPNDSWVLQIEPEGVVSVDKLTREITGIKIGHATIKLILDHRNLADGTRIQDTESIVVEVEEGEKIATPVKIMLHNRQTNRLVTMVGDITDTEEVIKIPNTNGTLLTEEQVEDTQYVIAKPTITNVTPPEPNFKKEFEGSQFMVRLGALKETHKSSEWQFALDSDFNNIIKTVKHETGDLTKCGHELFGITCYVRVRYNSESYMSPWSDGVKVTMTSDTPADSLRTPLKGNDNFEGCYYGEITKDQQVDNYDYRGTYNTLFQYNLKDFKVGWQVEHGGKLYYAKQVLNASNAATPGTDDTKWVLDTRENLPTIRLLMDMVGVGLGLVDNNVDGYSTGSTQLGALRKQDISWSKFMKHGRLIYVATEPIAGTICWNDIAKREAAYGERTIRYGTRLYRVRMLKQEEYEKFMREFCVGDDTYANKMQRQDNELIEDFQEGSNRNCYKFVEGDWRLVTVDPKSRTCFYRPVLELIATGSEPWRHWDAGALADGENFRYDKFTDTGYFGVVPDSKLINGANLCTMIGLTAGSPINDGCGWLKFYWHGMVVYISKLPIRGAAYSYRWNEQIGPMHAHDIGTKKLPVVQLDKYKYIPSGIEILKYGAGTTSAIGNRLWEGTMWHELYLRIMNSLHTPITHQVGDNFEVVIRDLYEPFRSMYELLGNDLLYYISFNANNWSSTVLNSNKSQLHNNSGEADDVFFIALNRREREQFN